MLVISGVAGVAAGVGIAGVVGAVGAVGVVGAVGAVGAVGTHLDGCFDVGSHDRCSLFPAGCCCILFAGRCCDCYYCTHLFDLGSCDFDGDCHQHLHNHCALLARELDCHEEKYLVTAALRTADKYKQTQHPTTPSRE